MGQGLNLRVTPSSICERPLSRHPAPALAPVLFQQLHIADDHTAVHRFAHVINRQQRHLHGGQGFHLDAGLTHGFGGAGADDLRAFGKDLEFDRHPGQRDRVAQRDQVAGALGAHDAGQSGNAEHITLFGGARLHQRQGGGQHADAATGHRHAVGAGLGADIDHVGLALGVEVGQGRIRGAHRQSVRAFTKA